MFWLQCLWIWKHHLYDSFYISCVIDRTAVLQNATTYTIICDGNIDNVERRIRTFAPDLSARLLNCEEKFMNLLTRLKLVRTPLNNLLRGF